VSKDHKIRKLVYQIKYLREELAECRQIYEKSKVEFFNNAIAKKKEMGADDDEISDISLDADDSDNSSSVDEDLSLRGQDNNESEDFEISDTTSTKNQPKWAKQLFRDVAVITHPDKMPDSLSKKLREKLVSLYTLATDAYQSGNFSGLVEAASELGIEMPSEGEELVQYLSYEICDLENKTEEIKSTIIWLWSQSNTDERSEIMNAFAEMRGWNEDV
jgi:hypothetical protein